MTTLAFKMGWNQELVEGEILKRFWKEHPVGDFWMSFLSEGEVGVFDYFLMAVGLVGFRSIPGGS